MTTPIRLVPSPEEEAAMAEATEHPSGVTQTLDLDAEAESVIIATIIESPRELDEHRLSLTVDMFTGERRTIMRAILFAADNGCFGPELDVAFRARAILTAIASAGGDRGGHLVAELQRIMLSVPCRLLEPEIERVRDAHTRREAVGELDVALGRAKAGEPLGQVARVVRDLAERLDTGRAGESLSGVRLLDTPAIFAPIRREPPVVEALGMTRGAPCMIAGYGYSRKTLLAQMIALDLAAERRVLGQWTATGGPVVHLDYEQGEQLTRERYQRLANGHGISVADVGGRLFCASFPRFYLDSQDAETKLLGLCRGIRLLVVDSLRAAAPTVDENSSEIRLVLDMLTRVSERTGSCVLIIHHAGKAGDPKDKRSNKQAPRGSSAIFDACASVIKLDGEAEEPSKAVHTKSRNTGVCVEPFYLDSVDVPSPDIAEDARWGLRLVYQTEEQANPVEAPDAGHERAMAKIREYLRENPGAPGKDVLRARLHMNRDTCIAAVAELLDSGEMVNLGTTARPKLHMKIGGEKP
jgi:hypothetical protein